MSACDFFHFIEDDGVQERGARDAVCHHGVFEIH